MAFISVTNTFVNGTSADATQVNTNFNDLVNGLSDSTKDISVAAITCTSLSNTGNTTLGNNVADTVTISGSLSATLALAANNSYDIGGSTLGLASVYYGSAGGLTTRLVGGATGSSWTMTLPTTDGISGDVMESNGSGVTTWSNRSSSSELANLSVTASVAANALTIGVKSGDGSAFSATNVGRLGFRSATATTGTYTSRTLTADPTALVISSGSTLGHTSAVQNYIYVYLVDTGAGLVIGASTLRFDEGSVLSTTAEGGAGGADSGTVMYTASAQTSKPIRLIARLTSTQATAGTWATAISEISMGPFDNTKVFAYYNTPSVSAATATTTTVVYTNKIFDTHSTFNTATGVWTCPKRGLYRFSMQVDSDGGAISPDADTDVMDIIWEVNTVSKRECIEKFASTSSTNYFARGVFEWFCEVGDAVRTRINQDSGDTWTSGGSTTGAWFTAHEC